MDFRYVGGKLKEVDKFRVDSRVHANKTATYTLSVDGVIFSQYPKQKVYLKTFGGSGPTSSCSENTCTVLVTASNTSNFIVQALPMMELGKSEKASILSTNPLPTKMSDVTLTVDCDELLESE